MNITRSEKLICLLLVTNAVSIGGWLHQKYEPFSQDDTFRQYRLAEAYDASLHVRKVNDTFYEFRRTDGLTGLVSNNSEYVIYGDNLYVDQVSWHNGIPEGIATFYTSNGSAATKTVGDKVTLANFGNFNKQPEKAYERITREIYQNKTITTPLVNTAPEELVVRKPNVKRNVSPTRETNLNSEAPQTLKNLTGLIPNTDCEIHYCEEGDKRAYPLPTKLLGELANLGNQGQLPYFELGKSKKVDLAIIWDPTCEYCKRFYRNVLRNMIQEGKNIRFMISTNEPFDRIPDHKKRAISELLCDSNPQSVILKQVMQLPYTPNPIPDCDPLPKVKAFKQTLAKFGFDSATPISFTSTTMLYGSDFKFNEMYRYLP